MTARPVKDRLDSWKEIAVYLNRDVRTVQRWERTEGLPVHRHRHEKLASVFAMTAELENWLAVRRQPASPASRARETKLAVLPFANLGSEGDADYFSDGLTEEMITQMTRLQPAHLAVIARDTAMNYGAGEDALDRMRQQLNVDFVLRGKIRRAGGRVRITAQLVRLPGQTQMWADTYDRDLQDILAVQADIAQAICRQIHILLTSSEDERLTALQRGGTRVDPAAYDAYLRGRYRLHHMSPLAIKESIEDFLSAIALDPGYAPAHASLASAYALLAIAPFDFLPPHEAMPKAEEAARQSLQLDSSLAEAHLALALVHHHYHWAWGPAERSYQRALELNPGYAAAHLWYSWLLLALGRQNDAQAEIDRTLALVQATDPHQLVGVHATRAAAYYFAREFQRAAEECEKALKLRPNHFISHYILGRSYIRLGQHEKGIAHLSPEGLSRGEMPLMDAALGLACAVNGQPQQAKEALMGLHAAAGKRYVPATYFGMLYAGLGQRDQALEWLERACDERADGLTWLNVDPMLDELRKDARFQQLVRKIGL